MPGYIGADFGLSIIGNFLLLLLSTGAAGAGAGAVSWPPSLATMMSTSPEHDLRMCLASSMLTPLRLDPFTLTSSSPAKNLPSLETNKSEFFLVHNHSHIKTEPQSRTTSYCWLQLAAPPSSRKFYSLSHWGGERKLSFNLIFSHCGSLTLSLKDL